MILHARAEHIELTLIPAADNIDGVAAIADVIDHGRLLRGKHWVVHRHVRGREHRRIFGHRADTRSPGKALEPSAVEVGNSAEALPAPDRHQRLELHHVGDLGEPHRVRPGDLKRLGNSADRAATVQVGAESSELELAIIEKWIGRAAKFLNL
jgi:hypothetical protein